MRRAPLAVDTTVTMAAGDLERGYVVNRRRFPAVDGVRLEATTGKAIGIVGESGSGKSTVARIFAGLDGGYQGSLTYNGRELSSIMRTPRGRLSFRRNVQMVSQDTSSSFDPGRTLRSAIRTPAMRLRQLPPDEADRAVDELLAALHIPLALAERKPREVSGGQRQRFSIARALIVEPRLLICDEVVSALDVSVQGSVLNLLKEFVTEKGIGMLFVSHGMPATAFVSDEIAVMYQGKVVEHRATEELLADPQHEYTRHLLASATVGAGAGLL